MAGRSEWAGVCPIRYHSHAPHTPLRALLYNCPAHWVTGQKVVCGRAEIALGAGRSRGRGWRAAHGHFAGGDLTDTPPPHQDAATFYVGNSFMVSKKTCAKTFEVV